MATLITGSGVDKVIDGSITSTKILDGTITNADINASAGIVGSKVDGSFGKVLQVVDSTTYLPFSVSSSTWSTILSCSITPTSASSKVVVMFSAPAPTLSAGDNWGSFSMWHNSSYIARYGLYSFNYEKTLNFQGGCFSVNRLHFPSTTSSTTYYMKGKSKDAATELKLNYSGNYESENAMSMILMEIGA